MKTNSNNALPYIQKIKEYGISEKNGSAMIVDVLIESRGYVDSIHVYKQIQKLNVSVKRTRVSTILRTLCEKGILERKKIDHNNHFVYRLLSLEAIEEGNSFLNIRRTNLNVY